jgi:uncharacterized membrane protein YhaH (DUF805 family)
MEQEQKEIMGYNERLLHEALQGNKDSFKELKFNAGAGDAEAQYYFAQYYAKVSDDDFRYWIRKAIIDNKYFEKHEEMIVSDEMSFTESVKTCFAKYATFTGRATRSEYWWFGVFYFLVMMFLVIIIGLFAQSELAAYIIMALSAVTSLALVIPSYAVGVRRLHDIGKSGWWMLVAFIPYIGGFVLLYFMCKRSGPDNEYGKRPEK